MITPFIHILTSSLTMCQQYSFQAVAGPNCGIIGQAGALGQGLSETGWVCGWFSNCASYGRPFYWPLNGQRTEIQFPVQYGSLGEARALAIASDGVVVGRIDAQELPGGRAFKWHDGAVVFLDPLPEDDQSDACAVNSRGHVVGSSTGIGLHACAWLGTQPVDLQLPLGPNSTAEAINDSDQICGWMGQIPYPIFGATPFIWSNGVTTPLPP